MFSLPIILYFFVSFSFLFFLLKYTKMSLLFRNRRDNSSKVEDLSDIPPFFSFNQEKKKWEPAPLSPSSSSCPSSSLPPNLSTLKITTQNIWFDYYNQEERYKEIIKTIETIKPHICAFVEVIPPFTHLLSSSPFFQKNYHFSETPSHSFCTRERHYGEMILLSKELPLPSTISFSPFQDSGMRRKLLHVQWPSSFCLPVVGVVHLESRDAGAENRRLQLFQLKETMEKEKNVLIMGDFNFAAHWEENEEHFQGPLSDFDDLWLKLHPHHPGYTSDPEINKNREGEIREHQSGRRIDRIIQKKSKNQIWSCEKMELIGVLPFQVGGKDVWMSDHFGLFAEFAWKGEEEQEEEK